MRHHYVSLSQMTEQKRDGGPAVWFTVIGG